MYHREDSFTSREGPGKTKRVMQTVWQSFWFGRFSGCPYVKLMFPWLVMAVRFKDSEDNMVQSGSVAFDCWW